MFLILSLFLSLYRFFDISVKISFFFFSFLIFSFFFFFLFVDTYSEGFWLLYFLDIRNSFNGISSANSSPLFLGVARYPHWWRVTQIFSRSNRHMKFFQWICVVRMNLTGNVALCPIELNFVNFIYIILLCHKHRQQNGTRTHSWRFVIRLTNRLKWVRLSLSTPFIWLRATSKPKI